MRIKKYFLITALLIMMQLLSCLAFADDDLPVVMECDEVRTGQFTCNIHYKLVNSALKGCWMYVSGTGEMADYRDPGYFCDPSYHPAYWSALGKNGNVHRMIPGLIIEPGITRIGDLAFYGHAGGFSGSDAKCGTVLLFNPVEIPDTVTWIGDYAFAGNRNMGYVTIPDGVTHIGQGAFHKDVMICCNKGSYAYTYATQNGYNVFDMKSRVQITGFKADNDLNSGKIKLKWNTETGKKYCIYRSDSKDGDYSEAGIVYSNNQTTVEWIDENAQLGETYYYKVRREAYLSSDAYADSDFTKALSATFTNPGVKAFDAETVSKTGKIKLSWSVSPSATGYSIYRATSKNGTYKLIKTINSARTVSYTDTTVSVSKKYYYKIQATYKDSKTNSPLSELVSCTCTPAKASAPTLSITSKGMKLKIKAVSGAKGYIIYRKAKGESSYKKVKTTTSLEWVDTTVKNGKQYSYKVIAYAKNSSGTTIKGDASAVTTRKYTKA